MPKIFYVTENAADYAQVNFFRTEKEAFNYGKSQVEAFKMFDEPINDEDSGGEEWFAGDVLNFKKGILFSYEDAEVYVQAMDEDDAKDYVQNIEGSAIFFDGFSRGMYGYLGSDATGKGYKWNWDGYDINEQNKMKNLYTFEEFVNEQRTK